MVNAASGKCGCKDTYFPYEGICRYTDEGDARLFFLRLQGRVVSQVRYPKLHAAILTQLGQPEIVRLLACLLVDTATVMEVSTRGTPRSDTW